MLPSKEVAKLLSKGKTDPLFFCQEVLGVKPWEKQREILFSVRDNPRTAVRSCNGAGKSFISSCVIVWFLSCFPESIVITTAPTARQVEAILWQEIAKRYHNARIPLGGRLLNTSWEIGPGWFALGLSTNHPDRFQGFHAENILGVIDEAAGVESPIYEAMDAILTSHGARLLIIGNPTEPSGDFYEAFRSPMFNKIHISAFDTPNFTSGRIVMPHLVTPQWVEDRKHLWGEDSPAYSARVLGQFPLVSSDMFIPLLWVMRSVERGLAGERTPCVMGFDVARFGSNESVIAIRRGSDISRIHAFNGMDTVEAAQIGARIATEEKPDIIAVDATGLGSGVADVMRHMGFNVVDIISNSRAYNPDKYLNKRVEMWFKTRELLRTDKLNLPNDDVLIGQLTSPKYKFDSKGRYVLERKEDMDRRGLDSPDRADAVVIAASVDSAYASFVIRDEEASKIRAGTVDALLAEIIKGEEEEKEWEYLVS